MAAIDYKQKIKDYMNSSEVDTLYKSMLNNLFPELKESKESEDERIRKAIRYAIGQSTHTDDTLINGVSSEEALAWLEKQSTPQVRTGLEWVNTIDDACDKRYAEEYAQGEYCHEQSFKWGFQEGVDWLEEQGEQKLSSKIKPKFKIGDIVKHKNNPHLTYILKRFTDDGDYEFHAIGKDGNEGETCFAVVKYQDEWELVEQNQTWSKEDEIRLKHVLRLLDVKDDKKYLLMFGLNSLQDLEKDIDWLKSLRPQNNITDEELAQAKKDAYNDALGKIEYHSGVPTFDDGWSAAIWYLKKRNIRLQSQWKPSDEQMHYLSWVANIKLGDSVVEQEVSKHLNELLEDLKKLREE